VHEHAAVGLDDEQSLREGQMRRQPTGVVDRAPSNHEPHGPNLWAAGHRSVMTVLFGWAEASKRAELGRTELRPGQYLPKGC
jgi:hypothetical protein